MRISPKALRIVQTSNLYLCYILLGMSISLTGPCLLDLKDLFRTDIQRISVIFISRSVGFLIGSGVAGVILDLCKNKQAVLILSNILLGLSLLGVPWSKNLVFLNILMVTSGFGMGVIDTGCDVQCLTLWGKDSGPFLQVLHFMFGLGGFVSPLVAAPFLSDRKMESAEMATNFSSRHAVLQAMNDTFDDGATPRVAYPFVIDGATCLVVAVLFLVVCCLDAAEDKATTGDRAVTNNPSLGLLAAVVFLASAASLVMWFTVVGFAQMLTAYAVEGPLGLSAVVGSYMTSAFWAANTGCSLVSALLAIRVGSTAIVAGNLVLQWVAAVLLVLGGERHEWALWAGSILLGAGTGSFYAALLGVLNTHIHVSSKIVAAIAIAAGCGEMGGPVLLGHFMEAAPQALVYETLASSALLSLIFLLLCLVLRKVPGGEEAEGEAGAASDNCQRRAPGGEEAESEAGAASENHQRWVPSREEAETGGISDNHQLRVLNREEAKSEASDASDNHQRRVLNREEAKSEASDASDNHQRRVLGGEEAESEAGAASDNHQRRVPRGEEAKNETGATSHS